MSTHVAVFLIIDVLMLLLAVCSLIGNGCILALIISRPSLRKNDGLFLITALSVTDFAIAIFSLPYIILLLSGWGKTINYPPLAILILAVPIIIGLKMTSCLTVAIAWDRLTAMHWPVQYRVKNKRLYAIGSSAAGLTWAIADVISLFSTTAVGPNPGCAAAECFMNEAFATYWGLSNVFINLVALVITVLVLIKLRSLKTMHPLGMPNALIKMITMVTSVLMVAKHERHSSVVNGIHPQVAAAEREQDKFKHANRIAINVLFCGGFCIFLPSCCVAVEELFDVYVFESVGPIVTLGLLLSSVANAVIYGLRHRDIRQAMKRLCAKKNKISEVPPSRAASISGLQLATAFRAPSRDSRAPSDAGVISRTILVSRNASDEVLQIPNILISDSEADAEYQKVLETALHGLTASQASSNGGGKRQRLIARENAQTRR